MILLLFFVQTNVFESPAEMLSVMSSLNDEPIVLSYVKTFRSIIKPIKITLGVLNHLKNPHLRVEESGAQSNVGLTVTGMLFIVTQGPSFAFTVFFYHCKMTIILIFF